MFTGIGLIAFCCIFGAGLIGLVLRNWLPEGHQTEATQKIVQTTMNVVAILAALVLGLLIVSTKTNFDTRSQEIETFSANLTLLDRELAYFGPASKDIRPLLRAFATQKITQTWRTDRGLTPVMDQIQTARMLDDIENRLRVLTPADEVQRAARTSALHLSGELKRTSRLLSVQQGSQTPRPFLVAVIFWVSMLFLSFTIFAPPNGTVIAAIFIGALSVAIAVNLIFDMDQPFSGFVRISPMPMQQAVDRMAP
jgi:uncharacterized membrane protein YjjB (DUF3815 family)